MILDLCEICGKPEYFWHNGRKCQYKPRKQGKVAFKRNSKGNHRVEGFQCSMCIINQLRKDGE